MEKAVVYRMMKYKTITAMKKLRFLAKFTGILVHDHETALYHFGTGYGECNVHIIRYLKKNSEDSGNNKMDNSLLAVRGINHKYIVVGGCGTKD